MLQRRKKTELQADFRWLLSLMMACFVVCVSAVTTSHSFAQDQEPQIPRVLILGDSVYRQPASELSKALKGKVEIVYPAMQPGEVRNSSTALHKIDEWLGDDSFDVIYFNFGLGDLVYRNPRFNAFRVLPIDVGGVRATAPQRYESNLRKLVSRLKSTNAKLVWGSTTPIRHSTPNIFEMGSEVEYNRIAEKLMQEQGVPIADMYGHVKGLINMDRPASHGADPFFFDRKPIHDPILDHIARELNLK